MRTCMPSTPANRRSPKALIWAAIAAATVKRYLAHMAQHLTQVHISTREVAMCAHHVLGAIVQALIDGGLCRLCRAIDQAVGFLGANAQRAHPTRDTQTGRLQLGLEPIFGGP